MSKIIHPKFFGKIVNGRVELHDVDKSYYDKYVGSFKEEQEIELTVRNKFKKRTAKQPGETTNQNGYYWAVPIAIISDEMGDFDKDYIHDWLQIKVGNSKMMPDGTVVAKGTSKLSAGEFEEYCSKVRMWCAVPGNMCEQGIYIPEPRECEYDE